MNDTLAAAARAPYPPLMGKAKLITLAFQQGNVDQLRQELLARAQNDAGDVHAVLDLSMALLLSGQRDSALAVQLHAVQAQPLYHMPASVQPAAVRLLALVSRGDFLANTPLEFLIADSDVSLHILYMGADVPAPAALPEHDALIVAVGESAANQPLLQELATALTQWHKPVLNRPEHVLQTSRDGVCAALQGAQGVTCPPIVRVDREALEGLVAGTAPAHVLAGAEYPVLVRPLDSHAGQGLRKIDQASDMAAYLQEESGQSFYLSQFVEYRSADQRYRKYRVVLVDGRPYLGHLGISPRWMVHYLNADMAESARNRAEEATVMENFDETFALHHADAFRAIHERLRLDYLVMDCAQTQDGRLLVFEADTCGVVHDMDSAELYPYKHVQMQKIFSAFRRMLADKADTAQA
jgi:hypothetical protein